MERLGVGGGWWNAFAASGWGEERVEGEDEGSGETGGL